MIFSSVAIVAQNLKWRFIGKAELLQLSIERRARGLERLSVRFSIGLNVVKSEKNFLVLSATYAFWASIRPKNL